MEINGFRGLTVCSILFHKFIFMIKCGRQTNFQGVIKKHIVYTCRMVNGVLSKTFLFGFSLSPAHELASLCIQQSLKTILIHTLQYIGLKWGLCMIQLIFKRNTKYTFLKDIVSIIFYIYHSYTFNWYLACDCFKILIFRMNFKIAHVSI